MNVRQDRKAGKPKGVEESETPEHDPRALWQDLVFSSQDGLRLHARDYAQTEGPTATPVLCLAGLSRNCRDFHEFAQRHSSRRRIVIMDYRGRGRSEYAGDPSTYTPIHEMNDALALLTILGIHEVIVLGTSRGGIIAMLMAVFRPTAVHGVILNDIGPEIEPSGLQRIGSYLERGRSPVSWKDAVDLLRQANRGFEGLSENDWLAWAQRTYRDVDGRPATDFDPELGKIFAGQNNLDKGKVPTLWAQFNALKKRPVLVLRGENSDILVPETVERMKKIKPDLISKTVPNRGHVPFLDEPVADVAITDFLLRFGHAEGKPD